MNGYLNYLKERPLLVAIKEWFHDLVESFKNVDAADIEEYKVDEATDVNINKLEEKQAVADNSGFNIKKTRVKEQTNEPAPKKSKTKTQKDFDREI